MTTITKLANIDPKGASFCLATSSINPNVLPTVNLQQEIYLTVTPLFVVFTTNYFKIT